MEEEKEEEEASSCIARPRGVYNQRDEMRGAPSYLLFVLLVSESLGSLSLSSPLSFPPPSLFLSSLSSSLAFSSSSSSSTSTFFSSSHVEVRSCTEIASARPPSRVYRLVRYEEAAGNPVPQLIAPITHTFDGIRLVTLHDRINRADRADRCALLILENQRIRFYCAPFTFHLYSFIRFSHT